MLSKQPFLPSNLILQILLFLYTSFKGYLKDFPLILDLHVLIPYVLKCLLLLFDINLLHEKVISPTNCQKQTSMLAYLLLSRENKGDNHQLSKWKGKKGNF